MSFMLLYRGKCSFMSIFQLERMKQFCFILDHPFFSQVCVEVGRTSSSSFPILERTRYGNHIKVFFISDLFGIYEKLFDDPIHNHQCASDISGLTNTMHNFFHLDFPLGCTQWAHRFTCLSLSTAKRTCMKSGLQRWLLQEGSSEIFSPKQFAS